MPFNAFGKKGITVCGQSLQAFVEIEEAYQAQLAESGGWQDDWYEEHEIWEALNEHPDQDELGFKWVKHCCRPAYFKGVQTDLWILREYKPRYSRRTWKANSKARYQFDRHRHTTIKKGTFELYSWEMDSSARKCKRAVYGPDEDWIDWDDEPTDRFSDDPRDDSFWERECFQGAAAYMVDDYDYYYGDGRPDPVAAWRYGDYCTIEDYFCECRSCTEQRAMNDLREWARVDVEKSADPWLEVYGKREREDSRRDCPCCSQDHIPFESDFFEEGEKVPSGLRFQDIKDQAFWLSFYAGVENFDPHQNRAEKDIRLARHYACWTRHAPNRLPLKDYPDAEDLQKFRREFMRARRPAWRA